MGQKMSLNLCRRRNRRRYLHFRPLKRKAAIRASADGRLPDVITLSVCSAPSRGKGIRRHFHPLKGRLSFRGGLPTNDDHAEGEG